MSEIYKKDLIQLAEQSAKEIKIELRKAFTQLVQVRVMKLRLRLEC